MDGIPQAVKHAIDAKFPPPMSLSLTKNTEGADLCGRIGCGFVGVHGLDEGLQLPGSLQAEGERLQFWLSGRVVLGSRHRIHDWERRSLHIRIPITRHPFPHTNP